MKKLILIFTITALSIALFAQTESLNIVTGFTKVTLHTAATVILDITDCNNEIHVNNDADVIDFTLPPCEAGLVVAFLGKATGVITVDPFDGVDKIWLEGADGGAGNEMESDGTVGKYVVLIGLDDTSWYALPIETLTWGIP